MNVMIVEDELASQQYLNNFLKQWYPGIIVTAVIDNVPEAIVYLQSYNPDILFLDVEIKRGTGFDILNACPELKSQIIFTTAFNQFAINAFEHAAVDYLLKPIEDKRLKNAIERCIGNLHAKNNYQQITALLSSLQQPALPKKRLSLYTVSGIEFLDLDTIVFAAAKGNYTELKLTNGARMTISKQLKEIEKRLHAPFFFRIHNSYIVQADCIKKYNKGRGGTVILSDDSLLPVSSARKDELLRFFDA